MIKSKSVLILIFLVTDVMAVTMPIGIPDPPSALMDADVDMYLGQTYTFSDGRGTITYPVNSVTGHPYTHYVDMLTGDDTDNPYGTEAAPRATIPCELDPNPNTAGLYMPEGSIIEIHNGTYSLDYDPEDPLYGTSDGYSLYCDGSESKPIFIRGEDDATLGWGCFNITGSYAIFENFNCDYTFIGLKKVTVAAGGSKAPDHCIVRNCLLYGDGTPEVLNVIKISGTAAAVASYNVVYNNTAYDYGDELGSENDSHFISAEAYTNHIWILNNTAHHCGGDGVQAGNNADGTTNHYYIGGNTFYAFRENAIDIKEADDVIISHNYFHTWGFNASVEAAVAIHRMDASWEPDNIWVIFNKIYDCSGSGGCGIAGGTEVYLIGNLFYNMLREDVYPARAIYHSFVRNASETHYFVNNTIYNCEAGFWKNENLTIEPTLYYFANNIIDTLQGGAAGYNKHLWIEDIANESNITTDYNLYYQSGGTELINWDDVDYSLTTYVAATTNGDNSITGDPKFQTPGSNFYLQADSPAIDSAKTDGTVATIYTTFQNRYGISIKFDIDGNALPDIGRSMGAYQGTGPSTRYLLFWTGN